MLRDPGILSNKEENDKAIKSTTGWIDMFYMVHLGRSFTYIEGFIPYKQTGVCINHGQECH